jgi:hypothetical protein
MSALGGQSGGHGAVARAARCACIANATALGASTRTTGCAVNREHENARSITGHVPRGNFSRTQFGRQVRPPRGVVPRAATASGDHARAAIAGMARKSRRRFRKTQNQGMLVDPVVNRMLWT